MKIERIVILGVGLLGGSLGMAAKAALDGVEVVGYGHRAATLDKAREIGAIDQGTTDARQAVADCDLVILCTPVGVFEDLIRQIAVGLKPGAIVTDVGSTKRSVVRSAEQTLPPVAHFVGSHPIAGSEKRGVEYARADLFANALCILTPTPRTGPEALDSVEAFWRALRMRTIRMTPEDHDRHLADVSHLPHALAAALVAMQEDAALALCGKGFIDATRIAGGDGELWRDILLDNADQVRAGLARLKFTINELEGMLERGDGRTLADWLNHAARRREALVQRKLRELNPD